jgi:hypothetical protein
MKKCMKCGGQKYKAGGATQDILGMPIYNATTRPMQMKKGGTTKNAKLAAMAPPKGKITRADIITAIKKKGKAKKK